MKETAGKIPVGKDITVKEPGGRRPGGEMIRQGKILEGKTSGEWSGGQSTGHRIIYVSIELVNCVNKDIMYVYSPKHNIV